MRGKMDVPGNVCDEIRKFAARHGVGRVVLFGSRARGTNGPRSDVDLFALGGDVDGFRDALDDEADTLLSFDVVDAGGNVSDALRSEVARDGVLIYEEV